MPSNLLVFADASDPTKHVSKFERQISLHGLPSSYGLRSSLSRSRAPPKTGSKNWNPLARHERHSHGQVLCPLFIHGRVQAPSDLLVQHQAEVGRLSSSSPLLPSSSILFSFGIMNGSS